ncbi:ethanolamine ammonia-lyase subunit EutC [Jannaschia sp. CCS1]|uniref:ethanolamine ammonia-lyase subunit EutC n=1 Tax=Jannaschia sp. (strain CCS1) TaxID=290400 RepID=UPI000053B87D|nr:ethanolamine ammonia-lyase subunit EutC [Jannaschia sp. CCS1]ABD55493.1 Ethanolamine ammonia-lyase light chain [Jannaschia sp. CCS1]
MSDHLPGHLSAITQARLTLGPRRRTQDTRTALAFALDHARAREAVLSELDVDGLATTLAVADLSHDVVTSAAGSRDTYIRRPDLGRRLSPEDRARLTPQEPCDVALVLGDGLSAIAVALNGAAFMVALANKLGACGLGTSDVILARQARVALGDDIAQALGAQTVVMALGERPGLSAADSLGVYITKNPTATTPDSARNCLSNIREAGLPVADAAHQATTLIKAMRAFGGSGVALNTALQKNRRLDGDDSASPHRL